MRANPSVAEISAMLAEQAEALCRELLPGGQRCGAEWRVGSVAGEPGKSLGVHLTGTKAGVWSDFAIGESGDALDLVRAVFGFGTKREAIFWSLNWLGLANEQESERKRRHPTHVRKADQADPDTSRRIDRARRIWAEGRPVPGTLAERYLRARGLTIEAPSTFKFHPDMWHSESRRSWPALVCAVTCWPARQARAIQTVYLDPNTGAKAPIEPTKKTFGIAASGAVRLTPAGSILTLAEGVGDCIVNSAILSRAADMGMWRHQRTSLPNPAAIRTGGADLR